MAIFKLIPTCKDYIWGGTRLMDEYHKPESGPRLAETWELSCHPNGLSTIGNGPFKGTSLLDYLQSGNMTKLGLNCRRFEQFPIMIKLIDAKDHLSIQVHPDNAYALANEGERGKTEMWYILDCDDGAYIYYGLRTAISPLELTEHIENDTLQTVLNKVKVKKGDVFFIKAGTIHAIGKGIIIAEIQQSSNITYRIYDYGRIGADGKPRDLHIQKAIDVINCSKTERKQDFGSHLAVCEYFDVDKYDVMGKFKGYVDKFSFLSLLVIQGQGILKADGEALNIKKGDSILMTASTGDYVINGNCQIIATSVPKGESIS
jgi:mannose-6-phosphate isomerase